MRGRLVQMPLRPKTHSQRILPKGLGIPALSFLIDPYYTFRLPCRCAQCLSILASRLCSPEVPQLFHVFISPSTLYLDFPSPCQDAHPGQSSVPGYVGGSASLSSTYSCDLGKSKRTLRSIGSPGPKTREGQRRKDECDQTAQTLKHTASKSSIGVSLVGQEQS